MSRRGAARRRAHKHRRIEPYAWLGAGAVTLGIGAATLTGAGIAVADDGAASSAPNSSVQGSRPSKSVDAPRKSGATRSSHKPVSADTSNAKADESSTANSKDEDVESGGGGDGDDGGGDVDTAQADAHKTLANENSDEKAEIDELKSAADEEGAAAATTSIVVATESIQDEPDVPTPVPAPDIPATLGLLVGPVREVESARLGERSSSATSSIAARNLAAALPNTAPTITSVRVSPGLFTATVYTRITATDPDRDKLDYAVSSSGSPKVTISSWGSTATIAYTPSAAARHAAAAPNGPKTESFQIHVGDGFGGLVTTEVTVAIKPANVRPSARASVGKTNPANGVVTGTINANDRDGDALAFSGSGSTPRGNVVVNPDGTFVYTPTAEALEGATSIFRRSDRFAVTVIDGYGGTYTLNVSVKIPRPDSNLPPKLGTPAYTISGVSDANGQVTGQINAADPEGFALTYQFNTGVDPNVGAASVSATAGSVSFRHSRRGKLPTGALGRTRLNSVP